MLASVLLATAVCAVGVQKGVERVTKGMMLCLLALMGVLAAKSLTLEGAAKGLSFYLRPDWSKVAADPGRVVLNAMGQAFFTLSTGVGAMTIFGSYVDRRQSLVKEALWIIAIDTFVAFTAGLVIFPACATYGVSVDTGPGLIFAALPKVFAAMPGGRFWGCLFFLFLSLAALTTVIAVFECLIGGLSNGGRRRLVATFGVGAAVAVLSLPCVFFERVLGWEDYVFSKYYLPLGSFALIPLACIGIGNTHQTFVMAPRQQMRRFCRWCRQYCLREFCRCHRQNLQVFEFQIELFELPQTTR
jgi:NSS family neurotransmitter:Na+ symporter